MEETTLHPTNTILSRWRAKWPPYPSSTRNNYFIISFYNEERERELSVKALKVIHGVVLLNQTGYSVNLTLKDGVDEQG